MTKSMKTLSFQFDDYCTELYNIEWYHLKPKEQKLLIPLMLAGQNSVALSSGGLKIMTLEWYTDLVNSGYSAALVLETLINK